LFPIRDVNPTRITPYVTVGLIAINVLVFFFWQPQADDTAASTDFLYEHAAVACELTTGEPISADEVRQDVCVDGGEPVFPDKNVWIAAFVSMFLHGGLFHLLGNMWFLWIFGNNVEEAYGTLGYLALYTIAGLAATFAFVFVNPDATVPLVGASGAIAGVLGAYAVLFPRHRVLSLVFVFFVPVPALFFLGVWFVMQFAISDVTTAWEAHVAGFVIGVLVTLPLRNRLLGRINALHATTRYRF